MSATKYRLPRWFGPSGSAIGVRVPVALSRPRRPRRQALLAVEPQDLLLVHADTFTLEQYAQPPVAKAVSLRRQAAQPLAYVRIARVGRAAHGPRIELDQPPGTSPREARSANRRSAASRRAAGDLSNGMVRPAFPARRCSAQPREDQIGVNVRTRVTLGRQLPLHS